MTDPSTSLAQAPLADLLRAVRNHPEVAGLVVWSPEDARSVGIDPLTVNWAHVEDMSVERGWESIENTGTRLPTSSKVSSG